MDEAKLNAVVRLRTELSPRLIILQVVPDGWAIPNYLPGQYTTLGLLGSAPRCALAEPELLAPPPDKLIRRAYSIASSPLNREFMEFCFNLVPAGLFSPRLFTVKAGDRIWLSPRVTGAFTFEHVPEDSNVVLIATGTGVAPFVSMLTTHLQFMTGRHVALVHAVRNSWELAYRPILTTMQCVHSHFNYLPVVSRPCYEPVAWSGATGRVQDVWKDRTISQLSGFQPSPRDTHVFLCGNPDMIESMILLLAREGFTEQARNKRGQIHVERYWPAARKAA